MRQVITLGAHIMNKKWSIYNFWKYHQQAKQSLREQNIFQLATDKLQSPTETFKWYKNKREKERNTFFAVQKLAQYSLTSSVRSSGLLVVRKPETHRPMSRKPWETDREDRQTWSDIDRDREMLQSLLIQRAGDLMAKCEIQVTIHTGPIICDALCWCLMSHSGYAEPLIRFHGKGTWSVQS